MAPRLALIVLAVGLSSLVASVAYGQVPEFAKFTVRDRVDFELPASWTIYDDGRLARLRETAERVSGMEKRLKTSFAAQNDQDKPTVSIQVTVGPSLENWSQAELRAANPQEVVKESEAEWREMVPSLRASLKKGGSDLIGEAACSVEEFGGRLAIVTRYRRTWIQPGSSRMVEAFLVPLGAEQVIVTLAHVQNDSGAVAARDRLRGGISIR